MRGHSRVRMARPLRAGVLALLTIAACPAPVSADDAEGGWFDFISDLFKRPEGAPVDVPLRKDDGAQPPASADPSAAREDLETAPPSPPPPPAQKPERREGTTLAHVYRAVQDLIAEIRLLRGASQAGDAPAEAELLEDRAPVHVYVKTLEVLAKVTQIQRRLGVPAGGEVRTPFRAVDAADILVNVELARNELERVKAHQGVEQAIVPAAPASATTPSHVYRSLAQASFLLDALRGQPLGPADVYRHATSALDEVALIAGRLGAVAGGEPPAVQGAKTPVDVAQQLLRAIHMAVNLQTRLHMDASRAPSVSLVRATPSQAYDMTNLLLAELVRIKAHLGIEEARPKRPAPPADDKGLEDAFAVVRLIVGNLDALSRAVED